MHTQRLKQQSNLVARYDSSLAVICGSLRTLPAYSIFLNGFLRIHIAVQY